MNTDIFELYQGLRPIRRVHLDGALVWAMPDFLPPHLAYLDNNPVGEQILTALRLIDCSSTMYDAAAGLSEDFDGSVNDLILKLVDGLFKETPVVYSDDYLTALTAKMVARRAQEYCYELQALYALNAAGEIAVHVADLEILIETLRKALSAEGKIAQHFADYNVFVTSMRAAISARGVISQHMASHIIGVFNSHRAVSATAELARHMSSHEIAVDYFHKALSASTKRPGHNTWHDIVFSYANYAISANSKRPGHEADLAVEIGNYGKFLDATAKVGSYDDAIDVDLTQTKNYISDLPAATIDLDAGQAVEYTVSGDISQITWKPISFTEYDGYTEDVAITSSTSNEINADTSAIVAIDESIVLSTMIWLFPVQSETNLYIPMIHDDGETVGVVQNGVELIM